MKQSFNTYEKYKNTEVDWIGEIPEEWEVIPLRRVLIQRKEKNDPIKTENLLSLSLKRGVIPYKDKDPGGNKAKSDFSSYILAYPEDIVVNSMNVVVGSVGLSRYFGAVSPVYYVFKKRNTYDSIHFFNAIFQNVMFQKSLFGLGNGILYVESKTSGKLNTIRMRIPMHKLGLVNIPYPSPEEQALIVKYLNSVNANINKFVKLKKSLKELLIEQKASIIHQVITGQINVSTSDQHSAYKDTNINWVKKIPSHWQTEKLRHFSKVINSNVDKKTYDNEVPVKLCNYVDVYNNEKITNELTFMPASATKNEIDKFKLRSDDVIITKDSEMWNDIGVPALVQEEGENLICGYHLAMIRTNKKYLTGEYLYYLLKDPIIATQLHIAANGVTRYGLSIKDVKDMNIIIPPIEEQQEIVRYLNETLKATDASIEQTIKEIDLLKEYQNSLVADVVTGKIDVRSLAATLPDIKVEEELEEDEHLEDDQDPIIEEDYEEETLED